MATYKLTKVIYKQNTDGTTTRTIVTVNTGLTFQEAKDERKMDKSLSIVREAQEA